MTNSTAEPFEEIEHTADAALKVYGRDWSELLVNAARGMFSLMAHWEDSQPSARQEISLQSLDAETLLVDWLSELLYLHEVQDLVFTSYEMVEVSLHDVRAVVTGTDRWVPRTAIKAVTYNELHVEETPEGLTATIVFDT